MSLSSTFKTIHEQAEASWINALNQMRLDALLDNLSKQDINLENALKELNLLKQSIAEEVIDRNRGGTKGIHGFIGERMQVALENAKKIIDGLLPEYTLIDDNGRDDYLRGFTPIQQKCVQSHYGLDAIREHFQKYPNFLDDGGKYQIPKDYYEKLTSLWSLTEEEAGKLSGSDYKTWKSLQKFFSETNIDKSKLEPMEVNYADIQKNTYEKTIDQKTDEIKTKDQKNREKAYQKSKPSLKEAGLTAAVGAGIDSAIAFCSSIAKKRKQGRKISEYNQEDWKDVGVDTGIAAAKGGIRGSVVYILSNYTCTPANIASALVTAVFGTLANAHKFSNGDISEEDFIINSEVCCLDAAISAVSALLGECLIPIPVLGAVIGTAVGNTIYDIAKKYCNEQTQECINKYHLEIQSLNDLLDEKYKCFIERLERELHKYKTILELAFDEDLNIAFDNSILLAQASGVDESKILKNRNDIDNYFLN